VTRALEHVAQPGQALLAGRAAGHDRLQLPQHLVGRAADCRELEHLLGLVGRGPAGLHFFGHTLGADFAQLVQRAEHGHAALGQAKPLQQASENLAIVHVDRKALEADLS